MAPSAACSNRRRRFGARSQRRTQCSRSALCQGRQGLPADGLVRSIRRSWGRLEPPISRLAISFAAGARSSGVASAPPCILVIRTVPRAFGLAVIRLWARSSAPGRGRGRVAHEHQMGVALGAGVLGEILERLERQVEEDPGPPAVVARDRRPVVRHLVRVVVLRDPASLCGPGRDRILNCSYERDRRPDRLVDSGDRSAGGASYRIVAAERGRRGVHRWMSTQRKETTPFAGPLPTSRKQKWRALGRLVEELSAAGPLDRVGPAGAEDRGEGRSGAEDPPVPVPSVRPAGHHRGSRPLRHGSRRGFRLAVVVGEPALLRRRARRGSRWWRRKFLTAVVRAERFNEGALARAVESGVFAGALRRALRRKRTTIDHTLRPVPRLPNRRRRRRRPRCAHRVRLPRRHPPAVRSRRRHRVFHEAYGVLGAITDDTQMTLFTAEGLILGPMAVRREGASATLVGVVRSAYLRWLATQGWAAGVDGTEGGPGGRA